MPPNEYHQRIIDYYRETEHAYRDSWDLDKSLAIHYGYWDQSVRNFPQSLIRMNALMAESAGIGSGDRVLDAGCGVGGSSIFLARTTGALVTGISLSERQVMQARAFAVEKGVEAQTEFRVMDYAATDFPAESFDVVWGCESICYADDKTAFIREAYRLLKPGGRLVVADGFVSRFENNDLLPVRRWLDGWQVNYLETPGRFRESMEESGFSDIHYRDISREVYRSARRLYRIYFLARLYLGWRKLGFSRPPTTMQKMNILACKYQYLALRKGLWQYGLIRGVKRS